MTRNEADLVHQIEFTLTHFPDQWSYDRDLNWRVEHVSGLELDISWLDLHLVHPQRIYFCAKDTTRIRRAYKLWRKIHGRGQAERQRQEGIAKALDMLRRMPFLRKVA